QRQPSEALSLGRLFYVNREHNIKFEIRTEFQNMFNRLFLASPISVKTGGFTVLTGANPLAPTTRDNQGRLTGGYGFVNWVNGGNTTTNPAPGAPPRSGQIVARVTF